jgi:transcriptional regulator with XRE-family HTH domain
MLGAIIRYQREFAKLTMRQLSASVGISNPYLSQLHTRLPEQPSRRTEESPARELKGLFVNEMTRTGVDLVEWSSPGAA